jgi:Zn-dependent peptidase ImmA (M78 family)
MRIGTPGFMPGRLTEARQARRIPSMSALARQLGFNPSSVSRWEDEESETSPDQEALTKLASSLMVRPAFFLRPVVKNGRPMFARSLASALVRDRAYQEVQMRWLQEITHVIQHYADLPPINVPDVMKGRSYRQLSDDDLEAIALDLRSHWKLGEGPCGDMVRILERNGFVVASIEIGTPRLDGLCAWSEGEGRPHVLLATDKASFARRQMDAAHEMAHAILHREVTEAELRENLRDIERQAFRLASAFLMPSTTYPLEVKSASLASLAALKERWRVSVKAQIQRLGDLDLINGDHATQLHKFYSARKWRLKEPFDDLWELQTPNLLSEALHLIVDSGTRSKSDLLATEFTIGAGDVETLCGLPHGWLSRESAKVVQLKDFVPTRLQN